MMTFISITMQQIDFSLKNSKTYIFLEMINFLAWSTLTTKIVYFPLYPLMVKDIPSLLR